MVSGMHELLCGQLSVGNTHFRNTRYALEVPTVKPSLGILSYTHLCYCDPTIKAPLQTPWFIIVCHVSLLSCAPQSAYIMGYCFFSCH